MKPKPGVHAYVAISVLLATFAIGLGCASRADALSAGYGEGSGFCKEVTSSGYDLGANYDNVWACGPIPGNSVPGYGDVFEPTEYGFQCTELANRFLWDRWDIAPVYGYSLDGANFAATVHADHPSVPLVANGTAGQAYVAGDIVSFSGYGEGHVAVVTGSTENASGNGQVTIMEENASTSGAEKLTVSNWSLQKASGSYVTPYEFDALAPPPSPAPPPPPPPPPPVTVSNLLTDGGFQDGGVGWSGMAPPGGGVTNHVVYENASLAREGSHFMEANTSAPGGSIYQDTTVNLPAQSSVTASIWARGNPGNGVSGQHIQLCVWDLNSHTDACNSLTLSHQWQQVQVTTTMPSAATDLRTQVYMYGGGNLDFDGAVLVSCGVNSSKKS